MNKDADMYMYSKEQLESSMFLPIANPATITYQGLTEGDGTVA